MPVVARIANDSRDYTVDEIPNGVAGQVYVVLSTSGVDFADDHTIAGPAVLEASFSRTLHGTFSLGVRWTDAVFRCTRLGWCRRRLGRDARRRLRLARSCEWCVTEGGRRIGEVCIGVPELFFSCVRPRQAGSRSLRRVADASGEEGDCVPSFIRCKGLAWIHHASQLDQTLCTLLWVTLENGNFIAARR